MKNTVIVTLADKNYIEYAKQLFSSVYFNAGWKGDYMLLAHEVPPEDLVWFKDKGIYVKECEPIRMEKLAGTFPISTLNKFYLFTPEFKKWGNVVFLDPDIIVRSSLDKLNRVKGFWACRDGVNIGHVGYQFNLKTKSELTNQLEQNFDAKIPAFNSGVMAFSTDIITHTTLDELLDLGKKYEEICDYAEQSILNLFFYKKWKELNFLYNFNPGIIKFFWNLRIESFNPIVIHICGKPKPWSPESTWYDEWLRNKQRSEQIDLKNRLGGMSGSFLITKSQCFVSKFTLLRSIVFVDKQIGRVGVFFKKNNPYIFHKIKKLISKVDRKNYRG